jgi:large subunit ribosomal protein L5e
MAFVKLVKNNAHFKRFQTKYRRRREGKTDYRARKRLITQAANKYNTPKYRMIVRISNRYCYCQVAHSTLKGDMIIAQATSMELKKFGLPEDFALKNWTACYATGLLLARRLLKTMKLDELYEGNTEIDGEDYTVEEKEDDSAPRPFSVCLDVGLQTTSTGARCFGALKGALDGGLSIPHNVRRWPACEKDQCDAEQVRKYIYSGHVGEYMEAMEEDDEEMYKTHFAKYLECDVTAENMEETWEAVHAAIRKDPEYKKTAKKTVKPKKKAIRMKSSQRKDRVRQKIVAFTERE